MAEWSRIWKDKVNNMLLTSYTREISRPEFNLSFQSVHCKAYLNEDVGEVSKNVRT